MNNVFLLFFHLMKYIELICTILYNVFMNYSITKDIQFIKEMLMLNESDFSKAVGIPRSTLNNWAKNRTDISLSQLERVYSFAYEKGLRINDTKQQIFKDSEKPGLKILFHGAKNEISEPLSVSYSKPDNDFGKGFYLGENLFQSESFVSNYPKSSVYVFCYRQNKKRRIKEYIVDEKWMLAVAYNRGLIQRYSDSEKIKAIVEEIDKSDIIIAPIADNNMYQLIDEFVQGNITDKQCVACLSATDLGKQYVFLNDDALKDLELIERCYICSNEKKEYQIEKNKRSDVGLQKVRYAKREYAGKGKYIDQLL